MELEPGDQIYLNGNEAEVIRTYNVGDIPYIRAYVETDGLNTFCVEDIEIEKREPKLKQVSETRVRDLHPTHDAVSAKRFDLRTEALRLQLAHEQEQLLSISNSLVRLEPYQLDCVNQVMQKLRQRALIADDVGLGKTIEAGLIYKELEARGRADKSIFIVPAHLRKKWVRDMERFFDLELTVADRAWVEGERRRLGEQTNIWDQENQQLVTSMAFLRQDEFQPMLENGFWDLVIVDESHKAAKRGDSPSKTSQMVETVTQNSDALLLLSATPHDGKEQSFRSLIEYIDPFIVAPDESLDRETVEEVMIRRGKETIYDDDGQRVFPERDVETVSVEMTSAEQEFYDGVTEYVREVYNRSDKLNEPAVGFAMALMQKRLVSSKGAIRETLDRRRRSLLEDEYQDSSENLSQEAEAYLEGEDLEEEDKNRAEQEFEKLTVSTGDRELREEIQTLQELVDMADNLPVDSKARKVKRYISQLFEEEPNEKLLLFTEYTDTLHYLLELFEDEPWSDEIMVIDGSVDKEERTRIEDRFNYGKPRLLLATDAASEGIDLQHSCHIMVNYELPWNPNRLEQRIGRIHRYGQDKEVKVWNFQFEGTREGEIFELLQEKIEKIRSKIGNTADVLGMLDDIDIDSLMMRSVQDNEPPEATKEELEEMIEDRQQTLLEWYEQSLVDFRTFDAESREKIQEVIDESEDVFGSEDEIREFFLQSIEELGGETRQIRHGVYEVELPETLQRGRDTVYGPITFDRDIAMDDDVSYMSPDSDLMKEVIELILVEEELDGEMGMKILPFVDEPGVTYNYRVAFEDGNGEIMNEKLVPVFVGSDKLDANGSLGERVIEGDTIKARPDRGTVSELLDQEPELREVAERYISTRIRELKKDLKEDREKETSRELENLEEYAESERKRIQEYIEEYREKAEAGGDMEIAIRRQESRLEELEDRIEKRKKDIEARSQVISIAPELENYCLTLPT